MNDYVNDQARFPCSFSRRSSVAGKPLD